MEPASVECQRGLQILSAALGHVVGNPGRTLADVLTMARLGGPHVHAPAAPHVLEQTLRKVVAMLDRVHVDHARALAGLGDPDPLRLVASFPEPAREIPDLATPLLPVGRRVRQRDEPRVLDLPATLSDQPRPDPRPLDTASLAPARVAVSRPELAREPIDHDVLGQTARFVSHPPIHSKGQEKSQPASLEFRLEASTAFFHDAELFGCVEG